MRIKLFEDFDNKSYYQISWEDSLVWTDEHEEQDRMKQLEIDFIMKEFPVSDCKEHLWLYDSKEWLDRKKVSKMNRYALQREYNPENPIYAISIRKESINLYISKHEDEYFYIILTDWREKQDQLSQYRDGRNYSYFLCDQLNGLKSFIMDFKKDGIL